MPAPSQHFDFVVLGAGPAGQKAAVQAAKSGRSVLLVDREARAGGECVHRGTIPSKTLRESAMRMTARDARPSEGERIKVESLMQRLSQVLGAHEAYIGRQLERNQVTRARGRARFVDAHTVEITGVDGARRQVSADFVVVATGSRPRTPGDIPVDHEHILDSDSILSLVYLPESITVLGAGVIACEFATIFQRLGVRVTLIDKGARPLAFLDQEVTDLFVERFHAAGGKFLAGRKHTRVEHDGLSACHVHLDDGSIVKSEKVLVALGRTASLAGLDVKNAGLELSDRGFLPVDGNCRTKVEHIYGAGDVIGPPALAASSMEQGRRAVRHALGMPLGPSAETIPAGIYTIPEMASVGLGEQEAIARHGSAIVGRARFEELARGQINGDTDGLVKLVCDPAGEQLVGAQILGEGATELIHLAQMAIVARLPVSTFVENVFNFPTLAEAYRVAALDVAGQRARLRLVG